MASTIPPDPPVATRQDVERLTREIANLRAALDHLTREHYLHVTRTGQLQADMDLIRSAWAKTKTSSQR